MSRTLVIHHANCVDGIVAAWAVVQAHPRNADVELHAATYGSLPPDVTDRDVIIVDFSYPRAVLLEMFSKARSLLCLDHHRTARDDLAGLPFCTFDMDRSGAGLAWDTFHPAVHRPWLVAYAEDRDLWRWKLPQSREVNAWLQSQPPTLEALDAVAEAGLEVAARAGRAVLVSQRRYIDDTKARDSRSRPPSGTTRATAAADGTATSTRAASLPSDAPPPIDARPSGMTLPTAPHAHPRPVHGWRPPPRPHTGLRATLPGPHSEALSEPTLAVDLEQHAPRIQDQGPLGSCVGQSTARAIAIALHRQGMIPGFVALGASFTDPADDARGPFLPSPLDLYRGGRIALGTVDEDSGAMIGDALKWAKEQGFAPDSLWPHEQNRSNFTRPAPDALNLARPHHRVISSEPLDYDLDTIRWELSCGFAVCIGVQVYRAIFDAPGGVIPLPEGEAVGGHAMCLSGFDNARRAFRVDQSWSESWGEQGRGWIPFEYVMNPLWCGEIYSVRVVRKG